MKMWNVLMALAQTYDLNRLTKALTDTKNMKYGRRGADCRRAHRIARTHMLIHLHDCVGTACRHPTADTQPRFVLCCRFDYKIPAG